MKSAVVALCDAFVFSLREIAAFSTGAYEFRRSLVRYYCDYNLHMAYEQGREFAHWITLRRFE